MKYFYLFIYTFLGELAYRSDLSKEFCAWWLKRRGLGQRCAFGGFVDRPTAPHFGGEILPPKKETIVGAWKGVLIQTGKILKVFYYQNYCIDFNQIWQKDKDHQVVNPRVPLVVWEAASVDLGILPSSHRGRVKHTTALRQDWDHCSQHSTNGWRNCDSQIGLWKTCRITRLILHCDSKNKPLNSCP